MSERQCQIPWGVSDIWRTQPPTDLSSPERKFSFQRKGASTMREASLDTTFFGGGSVLNIKSTRYSADGMCLY